MNIKKLVVEFGIQPFDASNCIYSVNSQAEKELRLYG